MPCAHRSEHVNATARTRFFSGRASPSSRCNWLGRWWGRKSGSDRLRSAGVASAIYYTEPLNRVERYGSSTADLALSEQASLEVLSLPVGPGLTDESVKQVIEELGAALVR